MNKIYAWHFVGEKLLDGQSIPKVGKWLHHKGPIRMCESGLHASLEPFEALQYAPGNTLCYVEVKNIEQYEDKDKLVCSSRKIIKKFDIEELLFQFSRQRALSVIHLWAAPKVVKEYLTTGDKSLRAAAWGAARVAAWDAAWGVARDAWAAARAAAWGAAMDSAWAAAWGAARDAARAAAMDSAWAAARNEFNSLVYKHFRLEKS